MTASWKITLPLFVLFLAVESGLVGGYNDANPNDPAVKNALQYGIAQYNRNSNDMFVSQVSRIIKAEQQVVAGMNYKITVEMSRTSCKKGGDEKVCSTHEDPAIGKPYECTFLVYTRVWENIIKLMKTTCQD
ncbi:hypothetical protein SKAU_G00180070 [Synaphobranchus kaupii]|uniref:Cystatin domain-containing protein n=1 Tax=Synaphobranchus kaupii TaxID=118154 RepID=A0A9Q1FML2_SYNKA|nr:hypothetical protein SKAU_G00180070 [Synaphobranchus kaupii]